MLFHWRGRESLNQCLLRMIDNTATVSSIGEVRAKRRVADDGRTSRGFLAKM
jgi:hypothetical protein